MVFITKRSGALVLRLLAVALLLGCPRIGSTAGKWSVIPLPQRPGQVEGPGIALAADAAGNLYVAEQSADRIQKRDAQGNWSVIATQGTTVGKVTGPTALAVDTAGNLYVAESSYRDFGDHWSRIQKRDAQGNWSVIATHGTEVQVRTDLAADAAGNLYVGESSYDASGHLANSEIRKRDAQGNWSVIAALGSALGQVSEPAALAVDAAGNLYITDAPGGAVSRIQKRDAQGSWSVLDTDRSGALAVDAVGNFYVADWTNGRIQQRDARGNWTIIAVTGTGPGQVVHPIDITVDPEGDLYVADGTNSGRLQERDNHGNWSILTSGPAPGPFYRPTAVAVDAAGDLYVADLGDGRGRVQKRDPQGNWSVIATAGDALGQVEGPGIALAADAAGNLYIAAVYHNRIQKRDAQGNWSVIATESAAALAVDSAGNLYLAEGNQIRKREIQGSWSVIPLGDTDADQTANPSALAANAAGDLFVASQLVFDGLGTLGIDWVHRRDAQGSWSVIATAGDAPGQVHGPTALAVDTAGTLYVADGSPFAADYANRYDGRIQMRDAQGGWSVLAAGGSAVGQVSHPSGLAVDTAGNLYVADTGNNRLLKYSPGVQ